MQLSLNDYQQQASGLCMPSARNLHYLSWGLAAEAGEVLGKLAKGVRDKGYEVDRTMPVGLRGGTAEELADVLWFVAVLADYLGYSLEELAAMNIEKLTSRAKRGVIGGDGDSR